MIKPNRGHNSIIGGLAVLLIRGFLLWVLIPAGATAWLVLRPVLKRRGVCFGQYMGWLDVNLIAFIQRALLRPVVRCPVSWVAVREMASVTHRLHATDPI